MNPRAKKRRKLQHDIDKVKNSCNKILDTLDNLKDSQRILNDSMNDLKSVNNKDLVIGDKFTQELANKNYDLKKITDEINLLLIKEINHYEKFLVTKEACNVCDNLVDENVKFGANCNCKYIVCNKCAVSTIKTKGNYVCPSCGGAQFDGDL